MSKIPERLVSLNLWQRQICSLPREAIGVHQVKVALTDSEIYMLVNELSDYRIKLFYEMCTLFSLERNLCLAYDH